LRNFVIKAEEVFTRPLRLFRGLRLVRAANGPLPFHLPNAHALWAVAVRFTRTS